MSAEFKFVYEGVESRLSLPPNASYLAAIRLALLEFSIPFEYEESVTLKAGGMHPISKDLFEVMLRMEEAPDLEFHIDVNKNTERTFIKFVYEGHLERIYYSPLDTFEDIMDMVFRRFSIPDEYKRFMRLSAGGSYRITPEIFRYQLEIWPTPEMEFHIQLNKNSLASRSAAVAAEPLDGTIKRLRPIEEKSEPEAKRRKQYNNKSG